MWNSKTAFGLVVKGFQCGRLIDIHKTHLRLFGWVMWALIWSFDWHVCWGKIGFLIGWCEQPKKHIWTLHDPNTQPHSNLAQMHQTTALEPHISQPNNHISAHIGQSILTNPNTALKCHICWPNNPISAQHTSQPNNHIRAYTTQSNNRKWACIRQLNNHIGTAWHRTPEGRVWVLISLDYQSPKNCQPTVYFLSSLNI